METTDSYKTLKVEMRLSLGWYWMDDTDHNKLKDPPLQVFKSIREWPPAEQPTVLEDTFLAVGECVYSWVCVCGCVFNKCSGSACLR